MRKDGRYFTVNKRALAVPFAPLALTAMLTACGGGDYTPAEPYEAPPLEDTERDTSGHSNVEYLERGLVVMPGAEEGNALSWRWSGLDEQRIRFAVYKNDEFFRTVRPSEPTFLEDPNGMPGDTYYVEALVDGTSKDVSEVVEATGDSYLSIPLNKPANDFVDGAEYSYTANDASAADLTGDGKYELILKWEPDNAQDSASGGKTGDVLIDAYTMEGELLWRINLGPNIRAGAHYTQFIAYDFNQDGRAEVAMKTADGTVDGRGVVIGEAGVEHRSESGYILDGPEFLTMFDGLSGEALDTVDYVPPRGNNLEEDWGDGYGNRVGRFLGGVAYLDGQTPSLVMSRGYYERAVVATFNFDGNTLSQHWVYDSADDESEDNIAGQGAHSLSVADVDGDGKDEIIFGAATLNNDGTVLYNTHLGHGDALHVADIIPDNPGLEVFMVHESSASYITDEGNFGLEVHDAATGEILISQPSDGEGDDVGRGVTGDIDPNYPGMESWGSRGGLMAADGTVISENKPAMNFMVWWDGDLNREMLDGTEITKWNWESKLVDEPLFKGSTFANGLAVSNNGTKATPSLSADLLGDWREEVVFANETSTKLMIYSSNIPTEARLPTLMHDRQYRTAIAWQNVAYNQPPHPSFYMGSDMDLYDHAVRELPQFKTQAVAGKPATGVTAQGTNDNVLVKLFPGSAEVDSMEVFRSESDARDGASSVGTLEGGETSFVDDSALPDITYYYWVKASSTDGSEIGGIDGPYMARLTSTQVPRVEVASSDNYVDLTWVTTAALSDVYIYRAETNSVDDIPTKPTSALARVNPDANTWTDESTAEGQQYYYWVELTTAEGTVIDAAPVFGENLVVPKTNLSATYDSNTDVMTVCWDLENVEWGATSNQFYRNDQDQAGGRQRFTILTDPDEIMSGCYEDEGPEGVDEEGNETLLGFEEGQGYWYMFKDVAGNEIVGPFGFGLEDNMTHLATSLDPELGIINLSWKLWRFDGDIVQADVYRSTSESGADKTLVREDVLPINGRLRDTGGDSGFTQNQSYWYSFEVTLDDGTVVNTDPEGEVLFELPEPETNIFTRLEDGGIRIDWNLENFGEITTIEILRNTEASAEGALPVVSEGLEPRGVYAEYDDLVEAQPYWYMMRVITADGEEFVGDLSLELVYQENPSSTSITINENEDGFCGISNGAIESNHLGYEGDGFANTDNAEGEYIDYKVNVQESGTYRLLVHYANGGGDNRYARVDVNSQIGIAQLDMEDVGGWAAWAESQADVELEAGETDIRLYAATAGGLGNVDYLLINALTTEDAPIAVACEL